MIDAIYWSSADVLILASQLASANHLPPPADLRQRIVDLLDRMVGHAQTAGVPDQDIKEARYALVAYIDEQILKSSWPGRGEWMNQPLQLGLYREFDAGEKFFARLRALLNHGDRLSAVEIYLLCLALGFRGAYGDRDPAALASFLGAAQQQVARALPAANKISPHAQPRDRAKAEKKSMGPFIALFAGCAVVVLGVVLTLQLLLHSNIEDALKAMPATSASAPVR
jgi:type VI secretion system protein ImpK